MGDLGPRPERTHGKPDRAAAVICFQTPPQVERNIWRHAEELLVNYTASSKRVELVCYVEYASYDSTDFVLQSTQMVTEIIDDGHSVVAHGAPPGQEPDAIATIELQETTVGTKKVLQMDTNVLLLLKIDGRYAILRGNMLSWLQVCDRNSAKKTTRLQFQTIRLGLQLQIGSPGGFALFARTVTQQI